MMLFVCVSSGDNDDVSKRGNAVDVQAASPACPFLPLRNDVDTPPPRQAPQLSLSLSPKNLTVYRIGL